MHHYPLSTSTLGATSMALRGARIGPLRSHHLGLWGIRLLYERYERRDARLV
jgi:hypothetical protein